MLKLIATICVAATAPLLQSETRDPGPPPEERTYKFQLVDVTYAEILDEFSRQSGLRITGDIPEGKTSFDCGIEEMGFELALSRLRMILYFVGLPEHHFGIRVADDWWEDRELEVLRIWPRCMLNLESFFLDVESFLQTEFPRQQVATVFYHSDKVDALARALEPHLPTHVRGSLLPETSSYSFLAAAEDLRRYIALARMLDRRMDEHAVVRRLRLPGLDLSDAVARVQKEFLAIEGFDRVRRERGKIIPDLTGDPPKVAIWIDAPHEMLIVRSTSEHIRRIENLLKSSSIPR